MQVACTTSSMLAVQVDAKLVAPFVKLVAAYVAHTVTCVPPIPAAASQNGTNGMNGMSAQLNGLNAAALALQALAAANPALLLNQNPWLAQHMQLLNGMPNQGGQGGAAMAQNAFAAGVHAQPQGSIPVMEAAQFAAQQLAAGQHLNGATGANGACDCVPGAPHRQC